MGKADEAVVGQNLGPKDRKIGQRSVGKLPQTRLALSSRKTLSISEMKKRSRSSAFSVCIGFALVNQWGEHRVHLIEFR
jgi:hypothetical protein